MVQIYKTEEYIKWFDSIKSPDTRARIRRRLKNVTLGNFGDHKSVGEGVCELRCDFAGGVRIYYIYDGQKVVLLLAGGDKSTQKRDIARAKHIAKEAGGVI